MGTPHYTTALDAAQQAHARGHRDLFAELADETRPATRGDVDALAAEVRALRAELVPQSSVILTGQTVRAEFERLKEGAWPR